MDDDLNTKLYDRCIEQAFIANTEAIFLLLGPSDLTQEQDLIY
jgi:hypothetical protein